MGRGALTVGTDRLGSFGRAVEFFECQFLFRGAHHFGPGALLGGLGDNTRKYGPEDLIEGAGGVVGIRETRKLLTKGEIGAFLRVFL